MHAPHTSDRTRPSGAASETSSPLCTYSGHSFIVASGLAELRGGLVAGSLAVVSAAGESRRCGADSADAFATLSAAASEEWEARSTGSQSMAVCGKLCIEGCYVRAGVAVGRTRARKQQAYSRLEACGRRRQEVVRAREVVLP